MYYTSYWTTPLARVCTQLLQGGGQRSRNNKYLYNILYHYFPDPDHTYQYRKGEKKEIKKEREKERDREIDRYVDRQIERERKRDGKREREIARK